MRKLLPFLLVAVALAGCANQSDPTADEIVESPEVQLPRLTNLTALVEAGIDLGLPPIVLNESVVDAAVDMTGDLYEPTMEVCADGSIYITGHTILVDTTGAPVFGSHDGGETWEQLPFTRDVHMPEPVHGATPPVTDEIYLSCGDDGWLYGADITLLSFPVNGWSDNGQMHSYYNPNAYDEYAAATSYVNEAGTGDCVAAAAKDRPWGAYANGSYLLVNNPASGPAQIGVLDMPPAVPYGIGATVGGASWNLCAGIGQLPALVSIPGIPALREDGLFVVPQRSSNSHGELHVITGNAADVMDVEAKKLFDYTTGGEITSVYGHAVVDGEGTFFVGITANSAPDANGDRSGGLILTASTDDAQTFQQVNFTTPTGEHIVHFWMDSNDHGPGALVVYTTPGDQGYDWYMGHLFAAEFGIPYLTNVSLVIDEGLAPSAHVTGAAAGPDGRAYTAMYTTRSGSVQSPTTPLSVFLQTSGPTLPVNAPSDQTQAA